MFAEHLNEELLRLVEDEDPWEDAACRDNGLGGLTALFFSEEIPDIARAKAICRTCPLQDACLQGALQRREPSGVWGGQLFVNGRILALKRRRGRPPKNPAPGVMLSA
jgi:WhiB family transcriptional regulator, redox-sensing transcriptional regulator